MQLRRFHSFAPQGAPPGPPLERTLRIIATGALDHKKRFDQIEDSERDYIEAVKSGVDLFREGRAIVLCLDAAMVDGGLPSNFPDAILRLGYIPQEWAAYGISAPSDAAEGNAPSGEQEIGEPGAPMFLLGPKHIAFKGEITRVLLATTYEELQPEVAARLARCDYFLILSPRDLFPWVTPTAPPPPSAIPPATDSTAIALPDGIAVHEPAAQSSASYPGRVGAPASTSFAEGGGATQQDKTAKPASAAKSPQKGKNEEPMRREEARDAVPMDVEADAPRWVDGPIRGVQSFPISRSIICTPIDASFVFRSRFSLNVHLCMRRAKRNLLCRRSVVLCDGYVGARLPCGEVTRAPVSPTCPLTTRHHASAILPPPPAP